MGTDLDEFVAYLIERPFQEPRECVHGRIANTISYVSWWAGYHRQRVRVNGKKIALVGDLVGCPLPGHGNNAILQGQCKTTINGKTAALHGFTTQCGCSLLTSCQNVGEA